MSTHSYGQNIIKDLALRALRASTAREEAEDLTTEDRTVAMNVLLSTASNMGGNAKLVSDYSGRCMFGRTCIGIVSSSTEDFIYAFAEACVSLGLNPREVREILGQAETDDFGRNYIMYWPRLLTGQD